MVRPKLDPPCLGWERDLPAPSDPPGMLEAFGDPPNHVDEIYLEFPRSNLLSRGVLCWLGLGLLSVTVWVLVAWLMDAGSIVNDVEFLLVAFGFVVINTWLGSAIVRQDLSPPPRRTHPLQPPTPQGVRLPLPLLLVAAVQQCVVVREARGL